MRSAVTRGSLIVSTKPGPARFRPDAGVHVLYLSLIVLIPLAVLLPRSATMSWDRFWSDGDRSAGAGLLPAELRRPRWSRRRSTWSSGFIVAWVLVRYRFPGKELVDAIVDLPFALPTAVSGIALTTLYATNGWIGRWLEPLGIKVAYTPLGVIVALTFIGLPFVVRTLQPALEDLDAEMEEAAASLWRHRWQTFRRVILPGLCAGLADGLCPGLRPGAGRIRLGDLHLGQHADERPRSRRC